MRPNKSGLKLFPALAAMLLCAGVVGADDDLERQEQEEAARQQAFRDGMQAIVDDLNNGSYERLSASIDRDDMLERILKLRLIDQKVQREFRKDFLESKESMIKSSFPRSKDDTLKATLLDVKSRGQVGRATVRFDLPDFQFDYHEYDLRLDDKNNLIVVDWIDFLRGEGFSEGVGETLIMASPGKPAVRKLVDFQNIKDSQIFQLTELLKAGRDRRAPDYFKILDDLDEDLRRQRIVVKTTAHLTMVIRNRRLQRAALIEVDKYFPEEPLYTLMLLDLYFPARRYDDAFAALERLNNRLAVEDAAMQARLSAATLVLDRKEDAAAHAARAVELEPALELGWWSTLRASAALDDYEQSVRALTTLEKQFGHSLGPEALEKDRAFSRLLASEEYRQWHAAR